MGESQGYQLGLSSFAVKASLAVFMVALVLYSSENIHFYVYTKIAELTNSSEAQFAVGHRYLRGTGCYPDPEAAMDWFKKAADQGHPSASFDLAVGHLKGIRSDILQKGEAKKLIEYAAKNGVHEARQTIIDFCSKGHCDE